MKSKMKNKMKKTALSVLILSAINLAMLPAFAKMEDDPIETKLMLDKFEVGRVDGNNIQAWEGGVWIGQDLNKLWL
jgi:uncharacterized protein involved in copper resistance